MYIYFQVKIYPFSVLGFKLLNDIHNSFSSYFIKQVQIFLKLPKYIFKLHLFYTPIDLLSFLILLCRSIYTR